MGENLAIGGRGAVRTPMQWSTAKNGGFSNARPSKLVNPVVEGGFAPEHVNASDQRHDPDSLLHFMRHLIERYRASAEIGWGEYERIDSGAASVFAHSVQSGEGRMIAVHNLASEPATVTLTLDGLDETYQLVDLLDGDTPIRPSAKGVVELNLAGYGYHWLRVLAADDKRLG